MTIRQLNQRISAVLVLIMSTMLALLIVPVMLQILARYIAIIPTFLWTEELARFLFVWLIMTGSMLGLRKGTHFEIDVLPKTRSDRVEAMVRLIAHCLVGVFAWVYLIYGFLHARFGAFQTSEIAELPMILMYIGWPLSGAVWLLFLVEMIIDDIQLWRGA